MTDHKIDLKTPWIAGLLAYLIPGAGHLYQRRYFKAILYFVCVYGTFLFGMSMGEWKVVYWTENPGLDRFGKPWKKNYGYLTQLGIGCPSVVAFFQTRRYRDHENRPTFINRVDVANEAPLRESIDAEFHGNLVEPVDPHDQEDGRRKFTPIRGRIYLEPHNQIFKGRFTGTMTTPDGKSEPFEHDLGASLFVDSKILGDHNRKLAAGLVNANGDYLGIDIIGEVPRPFLNWFEAPLDSRTLQEVNHRLTKKFEMALVYTWIAGLLNVLVIWDAVQGPAYGIDDEQFRQSQKEKEKDKSNPESKSQNAGASTEDAADGSETGSSSEEQAALAQPAPEAAGKSAES